MRANPHERTWMDWRVSARRRYLEANYGIEGPKQIERSNKKLFGKP